MENTTNINLIGINGYMGSGKDTVARMIQALVIEAKDPDFFIVPIDNSIDPKTNRMPMTTGIVDYMNRFNSNPHYNTFTDRSGWGVKKFAYKLKQIVTLLTGIPTEDLEKEEVKSMALPQEWNYIDAPNESVKYWSDLRIERGWIPPFCINCKSPIENVGQYVCDSCLRSRNPNYDRVNPMTVRDLLQKLGTDAVRNHVHPNAWVNSLFSDYQPEGGFIPSYSDPDNKSLGSEPQYPKWLISDCRFPNEYKAIQDRDGIVIRVTREPQDIERKERHSSETALDHHGFDWYIKNHYDLNYLLEEVQAMLSYFKII